MQSTRNRRIASSGPRRTALSGSTLLLLAALACASSPRVRSHRPHAAPAAARTSSALCPTTPPAASPRFAFPFDPAQCECSSTDHGPAYNDLECACASGNCPRNVEDGLDLVLHACATDKATRASRSDGCGKIVLSTSSGSCRIELSYDTATALLIGGSSHCDVTGAPPPSCDDSMQSAFEVGTKAECDAWQTCTICGEDGGVPACDAGRRCGL